MTDTCWLWLGRRNSNSYGEIIIEGKRTPVHRVVYSALVGPIPDGFQLDHLCRVRHCVRPEHLEAVTQHENILRGMGWSAINARKTHCPAGHPYSGANLRLSGRKRFCRACERAKKQPRLMEVKQ